MSSRACAEENRDIWQPLLQESANRVFGALGSPPKVNLTIEKGIGEPGNPKEGHSWLDPKLVNWKVGELEISCRVPVQSHGTEAVLEESRCTVKAGKATRTYTGADAVTIYRRLLNSKSYYMKEVIGESTSINFNLGPLSISGSQKKEILPK